jgi:SAM domain (Sterile alpha motif)
VDLGTWLRGLGMQQYERAFRENAIYATVRPELTADPLAVHPPLRVLRRQGAAKHKRR